MQSPGKSALLLVLAMVALSTFACTIVIPNPDKYKVGELRTVAVHVPRDDARSADVSIRLGAGKVTLDSGTDGSLLEGEVKYNVDELQPTLERSIRDGVATVDLIQKFGDETFFAGLSGEVRNEWQLHLTERVPLNLKLDFGAAESSIDLTGVPLTDLSLNMGAAQSTIRWRRPNPERLERIDVSAGAADLTLRGLGNANFARLQFDGGAANFVLDFSGDWRRSAWVDLNLGVSNVTLIVPADIGVIIDTGDSKLATVSADSLHRRGDSYANDAFGQRDIELRIDVAMGVGNLLIVEE